MKIIINFLIGYMNGATAGFDFGIDGSVLDDTKTMLYSIIDNQRFGICYSR